jgi:hypothetical protein
MMSRSTYDIVKQAIMDKEQVIASYDGYTRERCPHVIGRKNGREQALFYQFGGESSSGLGPVGSNRNWRCIPIDGLTNVYTRSGEWFTGTGHSRPQTCVDEVDTVVDY